jgi:hypothetical protein
MPDKEEVGTDVVDAELTKFDQQLQELKTLYDQFFEGYIKIEPQRENKAFQTRMQWFAPAKLKTTGTRFKFNNIKARYIQMRNLWNRYLREMEAGTFKRDRFHVKLHEKERQEKFEKSQTGVGKDALKTAGSKKPAGAKKSGGQTQKQLEMLYSKLQKLSGSNQKIPSKEVFTKAIHAQIKKHKQAHPGERVELRIEKQGSDKFQVKIKGKNK